MLYEAFLLQSINDITKFQAMEGALNDQIIVNKLISDFNLLGKIKVSFLNPLSYERYIELDMATRKMVGFRYHMGNQWRDIVRFSTNDSFLPVVES